MPRWRGGLPVCLDLAVTSGLRDTAASAQDASSCLTAYEDHKCSHLATKTLCNAAGLSFAPLVVEAVGGAWGPYSAKVFAEFAKSSATRSGESADVVLNRVYQSLGVTLHRENARSVLQRISAEAPESPAILQAAAALHPVELTES